MKPYSSRKLSKCSMFLAGALLVALVIIILLLLRSPSYVYGKLTPLSTSDSRISIDETSLRPLPLVISLGQRVEADILPQHMITTELFIARAGRVVFNVTVGAGTRMVLLGRHGVIPSLSLHDFYHPIRADRLAQPGPSHSIDTAPRYAIFEHFLVDGLWYLSLINERNRVEPISLIASMLTAPSDGPADGSNFPLVRCEAECNGHVILFFHVIPTHYLTLLFITKYNSFALNSFLSFQPSVPWSVAVTACSQEVHACVGQDLKGRNVMCMRIGAKSLTVADTGDVATKECVVVIEVGLETDVNW
uniref:Amine oxidase n=1 Tax=Angiostrongylus cantonensis TaxID=6313 RepID=A0A0K0DDR8_ANGCA